MQYEKPHVAQQVPHRNQAGQMVPDARPGRILRFIDIFNEAYSSASEGKARASSVVFIFNPFSSNQTPPRWMDQSGSNFQGFIRTYARTHIYKISRIVQETGNFC